MDDDQQSACKWYLLRTQPRADDLAAGELSAAGFEAFSPRVKKLHPREGLDTEPLFPGYIFLRYDLEQKGRPSLQTAPHVSGWVSFGDVVPPVPEEVVAELGQRVEAINRQGGMWRKFHRGENVRVVSGKVQTLGQVVEEARSPQSRVRVLMQFMGRQVSALVPWQDLEPVSDDTLDMARAPRRTRGRGRWIRGAGPRAIGTA